MSTIKKYEIYQTSHVNVSQVGNNRPFIERFQNRTIFSLTGFHIYFFLPYENPFVNSNSSIKTYIRAHAYHKKSCSSSNIPPNRFVGIKIIQWHCLCHFSTNVSVYLHTNTYTRYLFKFYTLLYLHISIFIKVFKLYIFFNKFTPVFS